jgi:phage N-6-adenine-methyltransferase
MAVNLRDAWRTPPWLFTWCENRYGPHTIDAAADLTNTKVAKFWTIDDDALKQNWAAENAFCNPPFTRGHDILRWLRKAHRATFILPARTDTDWFAYALDNAYELIFIGGRVNFIPPPGITGTGNFERTIIVRIDRDDRTANVLAIARDEMQGTYSA